MKTGKRIPIKDAKEIGNKHGYDQVVLVAWDRNTGTTSVCTWGRSITDCKEAAKGGNFVKSALGWPEELCHAEPTRIKNKNRVIPSVPTSELEKLNEGVDKNE